MSSKRPISELTWEKYWMEMNQGFWAVRGDGSFNDDEVNYSNSSRIEQKRSPQWFMDGPEAALLSNKRQAVGVPTTNLFSGLLNSNVSPLGAHVSSFYPTSGHFSERLFDSEAGRAGGLDDRNNSLHSLDRVNVERKVDEGLFGSDCLSTLSMSHPLGDPRLGLNYGGIRKVKVSQVKESEDTVPASLEHGYDREGKNTMSIPGAYNKTDSNNIFMGLGYNKGDGSIMTTGETYDSENNVFISMGQPYGQMNENVPTVQTYKEDSATEMVQTFSKDNVIPMGSQAFGTTVETLLAVGHSYNQISRSANSMGHSYNKGDNGNITTGQSRSRGESTIISFGGYDDDTTPSGRLISSYELFTSQPSFQISEFSNGKESVNSNGDVLVSNNHIASTGTANNSRKREDLKTSKKASANTFPSNVRSLLSTGMLDGVSVKYIAWSREKELRGVIKDSGYLCGCQTCNFSKVVNAYEFERHANCKTKHPNNHIYFENGKTVYGIVQELRSTPHPMLFEVMQTITGSPINQKSFRAWKESFLAATRELQRIYGTD